MTRTCRSNSHDAHGRRLAGDNTPETGSRLAALLVTIGLLGVLFLVAVLWQTWKWSKEQTEQAARQQAQMALAFDDAIRKHIATHVRPAMEERMVPGEFVPEAMSTSFVARSIFDAVRRQYPEYLLRFPTSNPRNPANAATSTEKAIIAFFEANPQAKSWSGTIRREGIEYLACAMPRRFETSCLRCHGRRQDAPASIVERYGPTAGFDRSAGEVAIDLVGIPVSRVMASTRANAVRHMVPAVGLCMSFLVAIAAAICVDARRRKRSETRLAHHVAALESANRALEDSHDRIAAAARAKGEFLANMSHEIRTPMTAILGYADELANSVQGRDQQEATQTIKRNGDHLLSIINDILDLSKIEAGELRVDLVPTSAVAVFSDVVSLMRVRAEAKSLTLTLDFCGPIPQTIQTDPLRLRQVVINLVGNAIKFTESGEVTISVRLLDADSPKLECRIIDTGVGLTQQQIADVFEPFRQGDNSTTRKHGGTGLGLAISKRLTVALGGEITVASTPGGGSTFSVTVATGPLEGVPLLDPLSEAFVQHASQVTAAAVPDVRLNCRVLLAEDGPDNQRLISFLLRKAGADVEVVENGQKALEMVLATRPGWGSRIDGTNQPFDVVLMDMQMPVMDGYQATRRLRAEGYSGPILALTAHAMKGDMRKCLDVGCDDYLTKPIARETFLATVAAWADRALARTGTPSAVARQPRDQ